MDSKNESSFHGEIVGLNRSALEFMTRQNTTPFLLELVDFFQDETWNEIQTIFPQVRNDYAHRIMFLSEDAAIE